jgi:hypothetical protein
MDCGFLQAHKLTFGPIKADPYRSIPPVVITEAQRSSLQSPSTDLPGEPFCFHGLLNLRERDPADPADRDMLTALTRWRSCPEFYRFRSGYTAAQHIELRAKAEEIRRARWWDIWKIVITLVIGAVGGILGTTLWPALQKWAGDWLRYFQNG